MIKKKYLLIILIVIFFIIEIDVFPRFGRGGSYRSSSSSSSKSSYRSSSSSSSYRSSSSSSSYKSSSSYTPSKYSGSSSYKSSSTSSTSSYSSSVVSNFPANWYKVKLKINRDYTVTVTETFKIFFYYSWKGINRTLQDRYRNLIIERESLKSSLGNASLSGNIINIDFKKEIKGAQEFTLSYKILNALLPFNNEPTLVWKPNLTEGISSGIIEIELPDSLKCKKADIAIVDQGYYGSYKAVKVPVEYKNSALKAAIKKKVEKGYDIEIFVPLSGKDELPALAAKNKELHEYYYENIAYHTIDAKVSINSNKTFDLESVQKVLPTSDKACNVSFPLLRRLKYPVKPSSYEYKEPSQLIYSNFKGNFSIPFPWGRGLHYKGTIQKNKTENIDLLYRSWGNFHTVGDQEIIDIYILPLLAVNPRLKSLTMEVIFPEGIKKDEIKTALYLTIEDYLSYYSTHDILREMDFQSEWKDKRLALSYSSGLFKNQAILVRFMLPKKYFSEPWFLSKYFMYAAHGFRFFEGPWMPVLLPPFIIIFIALIGLIIRRRMLSPKVSHDKKAEKKYIPPKENKLISKIMELDNNFSAEEFYERVNAISEKIQYAWCKGNVSSVRNFLSQGLYNRVRIQLDMMHRDEGLKNIMSDFKVLSNNIVGIDFSDEFITVHILLHASAKDMTVPLDLSEMEYDNTLKKVEPAAFSEIYSFTRKKSLITDLNKNMLKDQCPSCGYVPDNFGQVNKCQSCGAIFNSGEYDWVLSEITQEVEWRGSSVRNIPSLDAEILKNQSASRQLIEDRASYLFWRWIYAQARGDKNLIKRDAANTFMDSFNPEKTYISEPVVGAVDFRDLKKQNENTVIAHLDITWSCSFEKNAEPINRKLSLAAVINPDNKNTHGFADHGCDFCGAPLPETDALTCDYCGRSISKQINDWLLYSIEE